MTQVDALLRFLGCRAGKTECIAEDVEVLLRDVKVFNGVLGREGAFPGWGCWV